MKYLVFGNSGSGKSTYAKALVERWGMIHLDLDTLVWEPKQIAVPRDPAIVLGELRDFIAKHDAWVIEGCYGELVQAAAPHCGELVLLNPGRDACLANNQRRPWEPHKYTTADAQNAMLENLQAWVAGYDERDDAWSYRRHRQIFDSHRGNKREYFSAPDPQAVPS